MDLISDVFIAGQDHFGSFRIPSVIHTDNGVLLAFSKARKKLNDYAENKIVLKRSFNGGRNSVTTREVGRKPYTDANLVSKEGLPASTFTTERKY